MNSNTYFPMINKIIFLKAGESNALSNKIMVSLLHLYCYIYIGKSCGANALAYSCNSSSSDLFVSYFMLYGTGKKCTQTQKYISNVLMTR